MTYEEWLRKRQQNQTAGNTGGSSNIAKTTATSQSTGAGMSYEEWMNARTGNGSEELWEKSGIEAMNRDFWAFAKDERRWLEQGAFSKQYSSNAERWRGNIAQERAWLEKYGARLGDNAQRISAALDSYEETLNYYDSLYAAAEEYEKAGLEFSDYITAGGDPAQIDMERLLRGKANVSSGATVVLATDQYSKEQEQLLQSFQPFTTGTAMDEDNQAALGKEVSGQKARTLMALTWLKKHQKELGEETYQGLKGYYENAMTQLDLMDSTVQWYAGGKSAAVYQDMGNMIQAFQQGKAPTAELVQQEENLYAEVQALQEQVDTWQQQYDDMREAINEGRISEKNLQAAQENLTFSRDNLRGYQQLLQQKEQELQEVQEREAFYWALATNPQTADEDAEAVIERGQIRYADEMGAFNRAWNARADEIVAENPDEEMAIPRAEAQAKKEARQRYAVAVDSSHMTEEEKQNFFYLLGSGNDQLAIEYANATSVERRRELMAKWTEHASGTNILPATVAYSLLFPLAGADLLSAGYDVNTGLNQSSDIGPGGIRDAIVQGSVNTLNNDGKLVLPSDIPVLGGKGLGDLYSMALSGAESRGAAMAFGQYATLFLGLSAASSTYNQAVLNGADPEEAKLQAVSSGVFEALFESLSIGQFLDGKVTGSAVKDALIAAGVEASEETMTSIANEIADRLINQDQSQWEQTIAQYRKEGMSRKEAEDKAWRELVDTIAWDTVAGGLIGGAMGSGQTVQVYKNADAYIAMQNSENAAEQAMYEAAMIAAKVEADDSAEVTRQKVAQWVKEGRKGFGLALKDVVAGRARFERAEELTEKESEEQQAPAQEVAKATAAEEVADNEYYREAGERFEIPADRRIVDQTEVLRYIAEQNREAIEQMSNQQLAESIDEQMEIRDDESADDQDREMAQMLLDVMFEEQGKRYNNEGGNIRAEVSDESGQREDGLGTGEQTGAVAKGTSRPVAGSQKAQAENRRQSVGSFRQTESTSPEAIGVQGGSRENSLFVVAEEDVAANATLSSIAEDAKGEGANVIFYRGKMRVQNQNTAKSRAVEGIRQVNGDGSVTYYIKADGRIRDAKQIYEHEKFHSIVDGNKGLLLDLVEELDKRYGRQEVARMVLAYVEAYDGIYGTFEESMTADEQEELELRYLNELFADLYAEINRTRVNTAKAREVMAGQKGKIAAERENKKAMRNQNAPPQFSYAGENAKAADLKSLKAAQEMLKLNASMEDIRKATGWHQGKDGKWRFEIDDSGMKYFRGGDAQFRRDHPEYAEYQTLLQKMLFGTITSEEYSRMQEIDSTWGDEYGRLRDRLRSGSGKLVNVIQHDALFTAYPELENVGFQFQELPAGVNGYFDKAQNRIVLSEKLANAPESAILHEIQHVIQIYEGFAPGASVEYWEAKAKEQGLTAEELYRNTAGEIEARDAAARRKLTAEERKKTSPDYEDENTVFASQKQEDIRYSVDAEFADKIDEWEKEGRPDGEDFALGSTGDVLQGLGAIESDIYMLGDKIKEILEDHPEMTLSEIKKIPEILDDPVLVLKSRFANGKNKHNSRLVVFGTVKAKNKKPVLAVLDLRPVENNLLIEDLQKVSSSYTKTTAPIDFVQNSDVLYADKKRTTKLLRTIGFQMPIDLQQSGYIGSITYKGPKVNIQGTKFSEIMRSKQTYSVEDEAAELDEDYYRAMGREDLADELREMRELETEFWAETEEKERILREAKAEKERMAQEASIQTLKSRIAASEKALNEHKAAKQTLRSIGMYTEEAQEQLESKIANIKETLAIDREALEQKQKAKRKEEKQKRAQKEKEVIQDQKARSSLKQLSTDLLGLIHPKEGMRFELRNYIEDLGEKMIRQGALSQEDRTALFTMLYENGEEILEAPEYYADINERLKYGRVYVSEQVRKEFGDDWEAFRKKAWGLRIYLTNDINDLGIDQWTAELADAFGGAFSNEELDLRTQLETLIDTAEEGKAQHLTIGEMMARNRNEYGWSIEEQMDDLEQKVEDILFTFAQKAELEIQLRQRSMAQLIKERNRFRQIVARNQEQKMENTARLNVMKQIQKLSKMRRKASPEYRKMIDETLQGIDTVARRISPRGLEDLQDLAQRYYEAKEKQGENFLRNEYVESRLERLANMQLDNMDIKQVRELGNTVSGIIHSIEYSNKLLTFQHNESIETAAKKIRKEVDESEGSKGGFFRKVKENQLDAKRFFAELGGWSNGAMENFGKRLSAGQNKVMNYQMQASHIFDKFLQDKKNKKWLAKAAGSNAEWVTAEIPADYLAEDGVTRVRFETIELTPMMRVALLMHSKNADNLRHIAGGGMLIPDKKLYKQGKTADAYAKGKKYKLGPAIVKAIVKSCTEQEVEFAKLLSEYFDGLSKEAINETSMTIDGFERAGVWNYYPIISDKNYLAKQNDQVKLDVSIGSLGSIVNERVHAQNPLILEDASKTLMSHIDSISKYYGYAAVLRDLNAVLSHVFHMDNESFSDSVMATIKRKWGSSAEKYIDKIMADLQRPETSSDMLSDFFAKLRGNYAKAVISANPSSVLKQLSSYMVADAYLGEKALLYGMTHPAHTKTLEKYSALYWYRSQGNTTTEIGDVMKKREFGDKVPWIFNATQLMDSFVTKRLLAACEYQIRNETKLVPGTQEEIESGTDRYWMAVAKRFNEVVLNTQSNSTLMERPQLTRASDKSISRFFTMFRTDAFQQFNMLVEAKGRVKYAAKQYKANPSEANLKALKKARKFAARTYGGIIAGQCWVSFVNGLIAFIKGKDDDYRDEEGNWDLGKALVKFGKDMVEGFSGFVVGLDSIYSAVEVAIDNAQGGDAKWYDIEANGFNLLMGGLEQVSKLGNVIKNFNMTEGLGWIRDTAKVLSKAFGIPAENLENYLLSAVRFISPEWSEKYENFWDETTKADLTRESKQTMEAAIGVIVDNRTDGLSDEHKKELARLYQAGGTGAVPAGIPTSVEYTTEDGEKISVELSPRDREEYREVWNEIISVALPELLAGDDYTKADDERKAELIDKLYKYAGELAKHSVVPEKEVERWVEQGVTASEDGVSLAEYISFRVSLGDIDGKEKTGESIDGLKANRSMELLESMGWTDSQERNVYFDVLGTKSDGELTGDGKEMQGLLDAGLSWNDANNVVTMLGKKKDRINAIANLNVSDKTKAAAMMVYGTDKENKLFDAGVQFGVSFADYNEVIQKADADGNGSVSQEEAETYIRTMGLGWTEMAYLWQMVTDGKDGASNPFGEYWGAEFYNYAHRNDEEK